MLGQREDAEDKPCWGEDSPSEVPSWSWMAYEGGIRYGTKELHGLNWAQDIQLTTTDNLGSDGPNQDVLTAPLGRIVQSCHIEELEDTNSKISDAEGSLVGLIRYDCKNEDNIERLGCIAIAQHRYPNHGWAVFGEDADTLEKYLVVSWEEKLVPGDFHYVLIVESIPPKKEGGEVVYCRLGVAVIHSGHLSFESPLPVQVV